LCCIFDESWCQFIASRNLLLTKLIISTAIKCWGSYIGDCAMTLCNSVDMHHTKWHSILEDHNCTGFISHRSTKDFSLIFH
jgi:hypothetical protein